MEAARSSWHLFVLGKMQRWSSDQAPKNRLLPIVSDVQNFGVIRFSDQQSLPEVVVSWVAPDFASLNPPIKYNLSFTIPPEVLSLQQFYKGTISKSYFGGPIVCKDHLVVLFEQQHSSRLPRVRLMQPLFWSLFCPRSDWYKLCFWEVVSV